MKVLRRWIEDGYEFVEKEISPGCNTLGKYKVKKTRKKRGNNRIHAGEKESVQQPDEDVLSLGKAE